ncbi:hypothetical protein FPV67DRAFT_1492007 [Lyophyllum atratum]|nr:hypothetical protein FPV67DRAFT_1492007 [Lyophyllum atratum]
MPWHQVQSYEHRNLEGSKLQYTLSRGVRPVRPPRIVSSLIDVGGEINDFQLLFLRREVGDGRGDTSCGRREESRPQHRLREVLGTDEQDTLTWRSIQKFRLPLCHLGAHSHPRPSHSTDAHSRKRASKPKPKILALRLTNHCTHTQLLHPCTHDSMSPTSTLLGKSRASLNGLHSPGHDMGRKTHRLGSKTYAVSQRDSDTMVNYGY